jgi:hypothetical protein
LTVRWEGAILLSQSAMAGHRFTWGKTEIRLQFTLNKLECLKQAVRSALNIISMVQTTSSHGTVGERHSCLVRMVQGRVPRDAVEEDPPLQPRPIGSSPAFGKEGDAVGGIGCSPSDRGVSEAAFRSLRALRVHHRPGNLGSRQRSL